MQRRQAPAAVPSAEMCRGPGARRHGGGESICRSRAGRKRHVGLRAAVLGKSQGIGERGAAESVWGVVSGGATAPGHRAGLALDLIAS